MIRQLLAKLYFGLQIRGAVYFLVIFWLLVQGYLFYRYGVKLVPDSVRRYLPLSQVLLEGNFHLLNYNSRYLGYLGFLALFLKAGLPYMYIVLTQTFISGLAVIYLYKLSLLFSPNRAAAFLATFLFIAWKDGQYLNYFILTESLFTSFLIFSYYAVLKVRATVQLLPALFILGGTSLLRPNGFLVLLGGLSYLFAYFWPHLKLHKVGLAILILLLLTGVYIFGNGWLHPSFNLIAEYQQGEIIYGAPAFAQPSSLPLKIPAASLPPLTKLLVFILYNPVYFLKLAGLKVIYFLGYLKPYHSFGHILATVLIIYPMYVFSAVTIRSNGISWSKKIFGVVAFITQTAVVALTVEDWDNRFIIPFLPYLFLFGAIGFTHFLQTQDYFKQFGRL